MLPAFIVESCRLVSSCVITILYQVLEQMVKCGAAHEVGQSSTAPYTALIRACGKAFAVDRAFKVLRTMLDVGLKPNVVTFNCLIDACGQAKDLDRAS